MQGMLPIVLQIQMIQTKKQKKQSRPVVN